MFGACSLGVLRRENGTLLGGASLVECALQSVVGIPPINKQDTRKSCAGLLLSALGACGVLAEVGRDVCVYKLRRGE